MKAQRLVDMLLRLQSRSPQSAAELAKVLGVNPRTIYRDVEALSEAGVPVFATRGVHGGIHLMEGYRQSIAQLSESEVRAVFVSSQDPLSDLGWQDGLRPAREKLLGALSQRLRAAASKARDRLLIESRQWMAQAQPTKLLATLREAVWDERQVRMRYRNQAGVGITRVVDPLGLVFKAGTWYLVARQSEDIRTFRVERIQRLEALPAAFVRPASFQLSDYWERSRLRYETPSEPFVVRVAGTPRHLRQLATFWPTQIGPRQGHRATATVHFPLRGLAVHELHAWSAELEVLEPESVRSELAARVREAARLYRSKGRTH